MTKTIYLPKLCACVCVRGWGGGGYGEGEGKGRDIIIKKDPIIKEM